MPWPLGLASGAAEGEVKLALGAGFVDSHGRFLSVLVEAPLLDSADRQHLKDAPNPWALAL
jgi:hypothetical protein